jgi:hypothetical protein
MKAISMKPSMPRAGVEPVFFLPRISRMGPPDKATAMGTCRSAPGEGREFDHEYLARMNIFDGKLVHWSRQGNSV